MNPRHQWHAGGTVCVASQLDVCAWCLGDQDLQSQLAAQQQAVAAKEKEAFQLQEQVAELEAILAEPGKDPVQTPSSKLKDLEAKVAALEVC